MRTALHPQCIEPCSNWSIRQISEALFQQDCQIKMVKELITQDRLAHMTPQTMRAELAAPQSRIDRARNGKEGR